MAGLVGVLGVTAGIGLSRRGRARDDSPAVLANIPRGEWAIRAETPRVSPAGARDLSAAVPKELVTLHPRLAGRVRVAPGPTKQSMRVIVAGFRTREEAERTLDRLALWNLESTFPFRRAQVVEVE
jgi:hypothetical protein